MAKLIIGGAWFSSPLSLDAQFYVYEFGNNATGGMKSNPCFCVTKTIFFKFFFMLYQPKLFTHIEPSIIEAKPKPNINDN